MNPTGRFAILIPVYNHAEGIVPVIERARPLALPIWVVDDGSTDGTAAPPAERCWDYGAAP